jgi:hypothetical protein
LEHCAPSSAEGNAPEKCPHCDAKGKKVERITLMVLLTPAARGRLNHEGYRFCSSPDCDVVYFGGHDPFTRADLNVRVGQKETDASRHVCYCFNHTVQSIIDEIESTGRSTAVESIMAEIKAKRCACEVTNPQGTCCLGNVGQAVKEALRR